MSPARLRLAVFAVLALVMLGYCATHLRLETNVTDFLPSEANTKLARLSQRLADSELTRTMVLMIGADDSSVAIDAARELAGTLRSNPAVAWVRAGVDPEELRHLYEIYFPRRLLFLSEEPEREIPELVSPAALRRRARMLRRELAGPASPLLERVAPDDPLGAFARILRRVRGVRPGLRLRDGQFVTPDGHFAVVLLGTRASAFDTSVQGPLLDAIHSDFSTLAARDGHGLRLEESGVNRFAVHAERSIRRDVVWIAAASFAGVTLLFLAFFLSPAVFVLAALPSLGGILVATTFGLLVFKRLDGLTLAFGASLIGVAIDYSIHVLNHHALAASARSPQETVRRLRPALLLGAGTTMASFAGFVVTSFPGFRQIGVFAIVGVGSALVLTLIVLPDLLSSGRTMPRLSRRAAEALERTLQGIGRRRGALAVVALAVVAVSAFALPHLRWSDDLSRLTTLDPKLLREEKQVRARVSRFDTSRAVVAVGDDPQQALALDETVHRRLEGLVRDGKLAGMRSLHAFVWPRSLQERNLAALRAVPHLYSRIDTAFAAEGFRHGAFASFRRALAGPAPSPLTPSELIASPLGELVRSMWVPLGGGETAVITYLRGVHAPQALERTLAKIPGAMLFDQKEFLSEVYGAFRRQTVLQIIIGSVLVVGVLLARYRRLRPAAAAFLPAGLAALALAAGFALFGVETNLLHAVSLVLVMGMGVDYGVFLVDGAQEGGELGATALSLVLACATTVFVFGTLAFSSHPALRAIGVTTGFGILLSLLFSPTALLLSKRSAQ